MIYLATPYSHHSARVREQRFNSVNAQAARMMSEGMYVFSPISHSHPIAIAGDLPKDWQYWEQYCLMMLDHCNKLVVYMQDGWKESVGVQAEISFATDLGLPIEYILPHKRLLPVDQLTNKQKVAICIAAGVNMTQKFVGNSMVFTTEVPVDIVLENSTYKVYMGSKV